MDTFDILSRSTHSLWAIPFFKVLKSLKYVDLEQRGTRELFYYIFRVYREDLETDNFLNLLADDSYRRAINSEIDYGKLAPSCEKAIVIKFIWENSKFLLESTNENDFLKGVKKLDLFFSPIESFFANTIYVRPEYSEYSKEDLLNVQASFKLLNVLLPDIESHFYRKPALKDGYVLALKLIVNGLSYQSDQLADILGNLDYQKISFGNTHRRDALNKVDNLVSGPFSYFDFFEKRSDFDQSSIAEIIESKKAPILTPFEELDRFFLWYNFELLNSRKKIFSGQTAFESVILGEIWKRKIEDPSSKIKVRKIIHTADREPTMFSYAILLEKYGSLSDFSGWLIFQEVGGDYAGFGGDEYLAVEAILKTFEKNIELKQLKVSILTFKNYLQNKSLAFKRDILSHPFIEEDDDVKERNSSKVFYKNEFAKLKGLVGDSVGLLMELLAYYWMVYQFGNENVRWAFRDGLKNKEIDILAVDPKTNELVMIECSVSIEEPTKFIAEINEKVDLLLKNPAYSNKVVKKKYIVTRKALESERIDSFKTQFKNNGIELIIIEEVMPHLKIDDNTRGHVKRVFEALKKSSENSPIF